MAKITVHGRELDVVRFDGQVVGEPAKGGKVKPKTCPDWFPNVIQEGGPGDEGWAEGSLRTGFGLISIGLARGGVLTIGSGCWLIRDGDQLLYADASVGTDSTVAVKFARYVCPIEALEVPQAPE